MKEDSTEATNQWAITNGDAIPNASGYSDKIHIRHWEQNMETARESRYENINYCTAQVKIIPERKT